MSSEELLLVDHVSQSYAGLGFSLAWAVRPDGGLWPILYDERQRETMPVANCPAHFREIAPHELEGRLPDRFEQFFCGATTSAGKPCRHRVPGPGRRCRHHAGREQLQAPAVTTEGPQLELLTFDENGELR